MSLVTADHVDQLIRAETTRLTTQFTQRLNELTAQINAQVTTQLNAIRPPVIEPFQPVVIDPQVDSGNSSLDLIKSLPEFDGNSSSYPAWRSAAKFAMEYYPENSEKFYVATGILRNKVIDSANSTLSSFNTVLNFKAILARLDQTYSDKRPLHVLENELSILRQDRSTILEFYDQVDQQLTLIVNKQIMTFHGQDDLVAALNERARENALRVFISGLRRPLCDILFSARPKDLPSALVTAQELESNNKRNDFARIFAAGNFSKPSKPSSVPKTFPSYAVNQNRPIPMDVDSSRMNHQANFSQNFPQFKNSGIRTNRNNYNNNFQHQPQPYQNFNASVPFPQQYPNFNTGAIPKRTREQPDSQKSPFYKQQRINHMPHDSNPNVSEESDSDDRSQASDIIDDISNNEINFLE